MCILRHSSLMTLSRVIPRRASMGKCMVLICIYPMSTDPLAFALETWPVVPPSVRAYALIKGAGTAYITDAEAIQASLSAAGNLLCSAQCPCTTHPKKLSATIPLQTLMASPCANCIR
ncbi:hypothetical protein XFF7766_280008 [Xanthomonas citri pv. fuscans]|nr:hypothetical protein XFF7766_280008 [Xanthomonas citri pv. fuscans]